MTRNFEDALRESKRGPAFGEPLPVIVSNETLRFLEKRRSGSALTLGQPGPSDAEIARLLTLAARVPDHGKLAPWRFVVLRAEAKDRFVSRLEGIAAGRADEARLIAKLGKLRVPPLSIGVVSRLVEGEIPEWEQRLSAGAVCMSLIIAAQAMGYGANWITDWYAYDVEAAALLRLAPGERVAGYVHIGSPGEPPLERTRPDTSAITTLWDD